MLLWPDSFDFAVTEDGAGARPEGPGTPSRWRTRGGASYRAARSGEPNEPALGPRSGRVEPARFSE